MWCCGKYIILGLVLPAMIIIVMSTVGEHFEYDFAMKYIVNILNHSVNRGGGIQASLWSMMLYNGHHYSWLMFVYNVHYKTTTIEVF